MAFTEGTLLPLLSEMYPPNVLRAFPFFLTKRKTMKVVQKHSVLLQNNQQLWTFYKGKK